MRHLPRLLLPLLGLIAAGVVLIALMGLARQVEGQAAGQLLLVGMVLVIGALAGRVAEVLGLPRLTGYLVAGVGMSPGLWTWLGIPELCLRQAEVATLGPANDLAVGVIALMAGSEIEARWLRDRLKVILAVVAAEVVLVPLGLALLVALLPGVPFVSAAVQAGVPLVLVAALTGVVLLPNGPTVVITVLAETRAAGPLARMLMGTSVVLDAVVILLFTIVLSLIEAVAGDAQGSLWQAFASVVGGLSGSLLLGAVLGWALRRYAERSAHRLAWIVLGIALGVSALGTHLGIKPLFCLLAAGFAFGNLPGGDPALADQAHARLHRTLAQVGMPVFVVFFCAAGLAVNVTTLLASWLGLLVARDVLIVAAVHWGTRAAPEPAVRRHLWTGMVTQAGVTLALAQLIRDHCPGWGTTLATFIVAMVTVHELWVPVVLARALQRAGETRPR
jgi:Kef-type K+ transport system membrane component KefB